MVKAVAVKLSSSSQVTMNKPVFEGVAVTVSPAGKELVGKLT